MMPYYFAYGSNLDLNQMLRRCPTARPVEAIVLPNWRLVFRGVADIVPAQGCICRGGVFTIQPADLEALDRYEGFPSLYGREDVGTYKGKPLMAYTITRGYADRFNLPDGGYYQTIVRGYGDFDLDTDTLDEAISFTGKRLREQLQRNRVPQQRGRAKRSPGPQAGPVVDDPEERGFWDYLNEDVEVNENMYVGYRAKPKRR